MLTQFANDADRSQMVAITERDIVFDCPTCRGELVVDQDGAGMTLACSHCGRNVTVPGPSPAAPPPPPMLVAAPPPPLPLPPSSPSSPDKHSADLSPSAAATLSPPPPPPAQKFEFDSQTPEQVCKRFEELKLQLKENQSQTTEARGHANRATIDLHRLQLKVQKLQGRQAAIEAELLAAKAVMQRQSATIAAA